MALLWNHFLRREVARKTDQIASVLKDLQESGEKLRTLSDNKPAVWCTSSRRMMREEAEIFLYQRRGQAAA
jgi:hypothetical protein